MSAPLDLPVDERVVELGRIDLLSEVGEDRLRWLAERVDPRLYAEENIFAEGEDPVEFFFLLDGRVESMTRIDGEQMGALEHDNYTYLGGISLLADTTYPGTTRVLAPTRVLALPRADFDQLLQDEPTVRRTILSRFQPIFSRWGQMRGQREKLAALGEMSAGLAHELNNPASAAGRAAQELGTALAQVQDGIGRFAAEGLPSDRLAKLAEVAARARAVAATAEPLDALDRSDLEAELADALGEHGVADAYELAPDLVDAGIDRSCAEAVAANAGPALAADALAWVAAGARAEGLARELTEATGRISTLVGAVKEYTYMDQAGEQDVDIHRGLETTLTVLGHKLRKGDIRVVRELQPGLPTIYGYGSELNQAWTNLLDNAIDALDGKGTITIRTCTDGPGHVRVEIVDDGPGIPEDVQSRIFEPFFTTKDVGKGTGMGLDVTWRIVVQRHGGDLRVDSRPGETKFLVRLPIAPAPAPHDGTGQAAPAAVTPSA
jgi:signal transduction histidine kinase